MPINPQTTDQEWEQWLALPDNPGKPRYDPFEVFKPTKTFLREVIKELKYAQLQNRKHIRFLQDEPGGDIFIPKWEADNEKLGRRIRDYTYRLRPVHANSNTQIGPSEILRAKESHIQDYFGNGKLRRQGKDLVGLCPFHQDKHPSFTIYDQGRKFKCFSCGCNGDTIDFVSKTRNLKFPQAVKYILKI